MARFYGVIGYSVDTHPSEGTTVEVINERPYTGDIIRHHTNVNLGDQSHPDINMANSISVVSDPYAEKNLDRMRYVTWNGVRWRITSIDIQRPRIILSIGGTYNGLEATPVSTDTAE